MRIVTGIAAAASVAVAALPPAYANEPNGGSAAQAKPGITIGLSAGVPPPGIYMFNQLFTYQANLVGPATKTIGQKTGVQVAVDAQGFLFVPGWTFLGATYDAVIVQPFVDSSAGSPINSASSGVHNTLFIPIELSWKFGDSGFALKTGLPVFAPTGTVNGPAGLGNQGSPFWTFAPELIVSYLKDGWNLTAALSEEFNTASTITGYTTGDVFHADFTATKTIGKWTFGPVAYFAGQVSNDKSSAFYNFGLGTQRWSTWAAGALVGYDFGPAYLSVWATQEIAAKASGATLEGAFDPSSTAEGLTVLATLSYRIWSPDDTPTTKRPLLYK
jgi:hypothetical protein